MSIAALVKSIESDPVSKTFKTRPNPPRDMSFEITSSEESPGSDVLVAWKGYAHNYRVSYQPNGETFKTSETEQIFPGLNPGQTYIFKVVAVDRYKTESNPQTRNQLDLTNAIIMQKDLQVRDCRLAVGFYYAYRLKVQAMVLKMFDHLHQ